MQTLDIHASVVQCAFAHFASHEFIFIVQLADASILFYKYHGIIGFHVVHDIEVNSIGDSPQARPSFSLVEDRRGLLELLAVNSGQEVGIVECIFH